jgi:hypothetical protein
MTHMVAQRDRLSATADKWLFFGIWIAGTVGIILCKARGSAAAGMFVGVLMLLLYAAVVWRSPKFRVREDRAGDSAYYLGFLFTLISLAYSLWEFGAGRSTPTTIIGNFAIALATTIVGLALRVLFQQFREDPIEIEQQVRLEIADRVAELRSQLLQVVEDMSSLSTAIRTELKDQYAESLTQITAAAVERLKMASDQHITGMKNSLEAFAQTADEIREQVGCTRTANKRLIEAIERLAARVERVDIPTEELKERLKALNELITDAVSAERERLERDRAAMDNLKQLVDSAAGAITLVGEEIPRLRASVSSAANEVSTLSASFGAAKTQAEEQAKAMKESATKQRKIWEDLVGETARSLAQVRDTERDLRDALDSSRQALRQTHASLASLATTVVEELHVR